MPTAPFTIDPVLTGIAMTYMPQGMIADMVLPRSLPLAKQEFKYNVWDLANRFTIPDTRIGRKSAANEVEFSATESTDSTEDHGLDDVVPNDDIANAAEGLDPLGYATESLADLLALGREKRVADTVFAAATYPTGNKKTISGTDQWNDTTNSDPITEISDALDVPVIRPNKMVLGQAVWTTLRRHPKIIQAVNMVGGDTAGMASRQAVAELFELEEILVGKSFSNTAKPGQSVALSRLWGKHCSLIWSDRLAVTPNSNRITFGITAQFASIVSGTMDEPKIGLRGAQRVRVGESVKEVITANDVAYFLENAIA